MMNMTNLYPTNDVYALHNDMCYENKAMANAMVEQIPPAHHTIRLSSAADCEKPKKVQEDVDLKNFMPRRLRLTIIADILTTIIVFTILISVELGVIPYRKLGFRCGDPTISFPYRGDTITLYQLLLISYLGPLVLLVFIEMARERSIKLIRLGVIWEHYKEFLIGVSFVLLITEIAKAVIGEHRPHFLEVCRPDKNEGCENGVFIEDYSCTNQAYSSFVITDASKSFPSGHSSLSVFTSLFCGYVVQTRLPSAVTGRLFKVFLIAICLSWGIICSLSRIADRRHHWWDVLSGTVLGILGVVFFTTIFHQKQRRKLQRTSEQSVSSTMLLDVKNKTAASARV